MTPLLAHSEDHARELIAVLITECRGGISDREAEALALADRFRIEKEPISARFATARKLKAQEFTERGADIGAELDAATAKAQAKERAPAPLRMRRLDEPGPTPLKVRRIDDTSSTLKRPSEPKAKREMAEAKLKPPTSPDPLSSPAGAVGAELLTYPRGLLGHVTQYIIDTAGLPDRTMALAGALSVCAKALDRKVIGPTGNSTVLFNLLIAETGTGKQHIINCIRMLLRAMGMEEVIAASGIASVQSIEEVLEGKNEVEGKPSALVVIDEYGSFLSRVSSKGQGGNVAEILSSLQTLWGWPPEMEWVGSIKVGKEMVKVYGPAFAIFGSSTERAFPDTCYSMPGAAPWNE
jgi:hypothetical protein